MKTILKWPGGKEKELPVIRDYIPDYTGRFVEPFVGGGAVFFDTQKENCCINDKSVELINLYQSIKTQDAAFVEYAQLECDEFSSIGALVDKNTEDILSLYHGTLSVSDFLKQFSPFFGK